MSLPLPCPQPATSPPRLNLTLGRSSCGGGEAESISPACFCPKIVPFQARKSSCLPLVPCFLIPSSAEAGKGSCGEVGAALGRNRHHNHSHLSLGWPFVTRAVPGESPKKGCTIVLVLLLVPLLNLGPEILKSPGKNLVGKEYVGRQGSPPSLLWHTKYISSALLQY